MTPDEKRHWRRIVEADIERRTAMLEYGWERLRSLVAEVLETSAGPNWLPVAIGIVSEWPIDRQMEIFSSLYRTNIQTHTQLDRSREIMARFDSGWLAFALAPEVERTLVGIENNDWETYRRLAELLDYLGQEALLAKVVASAAESNDDDVREIAEDYRRNDP